MRIHAKAQRGERFERSRLARGEIFAVNEQKIREEHQPAVGDNGRLERAQRSRGGVAWIDEGRQPFALALLVEAHERRLRHYDFAAHFKCLSLREAQLLKLCGRERKRHTANGADIRSHVFAGLAVAAR